MRLVALLVVTMALVCGCANQDQLSARPNPGSGDAFIMFGMRMMQMSGGSTPDARQMRTTNCVPTPIGGFTCTSY